MQATARLADVSPNTVAKLLTAAGTVCADLHDERVRGVAAKRVRCDGIRAFCHAKAKNVPAAKAAPENAGDVWTWTAFDPDSKLMVACAVGDRDAETARAFMFDLADRLAGRARLTTDGPRAALKAVTDAFSGDADHARLIELLGEPTGAKGHERKHGPAECPGIIEEPVFGKPDAAHIGASPVERRNLDMPMGMRRLTRLTSGCSRKVESHAAMVALYTMHDNFCRPHTTNRVTPAMEAGLSDHAWDMGEVVAIMDERAPKPGCPKTCRPRISN